MVSASADEKASIEKAYNWVFPDEYDDMKWLASGGNSKIMDALEVCWYRGTASENNQAAIREAYYSVHIPEYRELKQSAIDGDPVAKDTLESKWNEQGISDLFKEKDPIRTAFLSAAIERTKKGDSKTKDWLEIKWKNDGSNDPENNNQRWIIRDAYYNALQKKVEKGDSEAMILLDSAWYESKTRVGSGAPMMLLAMYYKHHYEECKQKALSGDFKARLALDDIWLRKYITPIPSEQEQADILDKSDKAFANLYADLKQKTMNGETTALDSLKRIWWFCKNMGGMTREAPCISISNEDQASVRKAYNSASVQKLLGLDFNELVQKASGGDDKAKDLLEEKWKDGTIESSEKEKDSIQRAFDRAKAHESWKKEAREEGDWSAMRSVRDDWKAGKYPCSEQEKTSIENEYNAALSRKYQELKEQAGKGIREAIIALEDCWVQKAVSVSPEDQTSIRDSYNSAVLPNYKELKQKAESDDEGALTTLKEKWKDPDTYLGSDEWTILLSAEEQHSLLYKFYKVKAGKGNRDAIEKLQSIWDAKTVSISDADKALIIDSYNSAALPRFNELKQKAAQGDTTALTTLQNNWRDKKSMYTSRWGQWTIIVSDEEQESILYKYYTVQAGKKGNRDAIEKLQDIWDAIPKEIQNLAAGA